MKDEIESMKQCLKDKDTRIRVLETDVIKLHERFKKTKNWILFTLMISCFLLEVAGGILIAYSMEGNAWETTWEPGWRTTHIIKPFECIMFVILTVTAIIATYWWFIRRMME